MEQWKKVPDYERYEVSNRGRVRSLHKGGYRILSPYRKGGGYVAIDLCTGGSHKTVAVHRMVGLLFVPNPKCKPCINHKDGDRANNNAANIEWVTVSENNSYCRKMGRDRCFGKERKSVIATDIITKKEYYFDGVREAEKYGFCSSSISKCCKGKQREHKGFFWRYAYGEHNST